MHLLRSWGFGFFTILSIFSSTSPNFNQFKFQLILIGLETFKSSSLGMSLKINMEKVGTNLESKYHQCRHM